MKADVVALGEILIDFASERTDENGYPVMAAHPGGAPANFLAAVAASGLGAAMIGKVGMDAFGRMLVGTLNAAGIETRGVVRDGSCFTTLAFVTFDENGDRSFSFARKPGADTRLTEKELDLKLIDECRVFHFGTLSLTDEPAASATKAAVDYAKAHGKLVSFDPNLREVLWNDLEKAKEAMMWGLRQADIVKISDNEAEFLFKMNPAQAARYMFDIFSPKLLFVTCGDKGSYYKNRNAAGFVHAEAAGKVIDTTGAGDIFGGSALAKTLLSGKEPEDLMNEDLVAIASYASKVAGISVTRPGGISSIPKKEELAAL